MRRPRVLLDVDGPLGDFIAPALEAIFQVTGRRYTHADHVNGWDIFTGLGLSEDEISAVFKAMQVPGLCLSIPLVDGALEGVTALRKFADVWAVTSPFGGNHWMHERDAWLVKNFGFRKHHVLHVRGEAKHAVTGDMLVEDKTATLVEWRAHNPTGIPVLFGLPYNRHDGWNGLAADGWVELVAIAEAHLKPPALL